MQFFNIIIAALAPSLIAAQYVPKTYNMEGRFNARAELGTVRLKGSSLDTLVYVAEPRHTLDLSFGA
ncbi:uncharacterized protein L3040_002186 [Drepanopeziza brunnea f. sp. 'multigermtubi']|uniref:uncharacterized protein n=1 Tax=Drepanopeziza brunnea f. sp. 'multigermtubi' TaxID=698441 RepID=UPI0023933D32|nr:hypothetical protein L3040_002186 [Drepanopeziza brunnea f. sp. 'multigermtubi']